MSGIVDTTGAASGVIGTTVGTPDGGKILQVSYVKFTSGSAATTTTTYQDYPQLTLTMTPTASSSKFWMSATPHFYMNSHADDGWRTANLAFYRTISGGAAGVVYESGAAGGEGYSWAVYETNNEHRFMGRIPIFWLDSPSTTSAVTYKVQFKANGGSNNLLTDPTYGAADLTLMEVAG